MTQDTPDTEEIQTQDETDLIDTDQTDFMNGMVVSPTVMDTIQIDDVDGNTIDVRKPRRITISDFLGQEIMITRLSHEKVSMGEEPYHFRNIGFFGKDKVYHEMPISGVLMDSLSNFITDEEISDGGQVTPIILSVEKKLSQKGKVYHYFTF